MDKRFLLILGVVIAVFIGLVAMSGDSEDSGATFDGNPLEVQETDVTQGSAESGVTLIEYADFQCPGCGALFPALQQVKQDLDGQFLFVFRHFPLTTIHPNAMAAHRASEAARLQGKFWEMHDLLFARQQVWSNSNNAPQIFEGYAEELELDLEQYKTDVASQTVLDAIQTDRDSGNQLDISATPTLYLNGERIDTPRTVDELRQVLQAAIDAAAGSDQGTEATE